MTLSNLHGLSVTGNEKIAIYVRKETVLPQNKFKCVEIRICLFCLFEHSLIIIINQHPLTPHCHHFPEILFAKCSQEPCELGSTEWSCRVTVIC